MVISASLHACGVVFPLAMLTSTCRSIVTICSGLYLLMGMTCFPPSGFSLFPPGTNSPVRSVVPRDHQAGRHRHERPRVRELSVVPHSIVLGHRGGLSSSQISLPLPCLFAASLHGNE